MREQIVGFGAQKIIFNYFCPEVILGCGVVAGVSRNIEENKNFDQSMNMWRVLTTEIYPLEENTNFSVPT